MLVRERFLEGIFEWVMIKDEINIICLLMSNGIIIVVEDLILFVIEIGGYSYMNVNVGKLLFDVIVKIDGNLLNKEFVSVGLFNFVV